MASARGIDPLVLLLGALAPLVVVVASSLSLVRPVPRAGRLLVYSCVGAMVAVAVVGITFVVVTLRGIQVRDDVGRIGDELIALFLGALLGALCFGLREFSGKRSGGDQGLIAPRQKR